LHCYWRRKDYTVTEVNSKWIEVAILTRVLLNLIVDGFYAANKRSREGDGTYRPH